MKPRNILLSLLLCATAASAQDIITKTDGTTIDAKVEEITETAIRYHKASNPTGPVYTIALTNVASITYENGTVDRFNVQTQITQPTTSYNELSQHTTTMTSSNTSSQMSDAQLLRMSMSKSMGDVYTDPKELYSKAKKMRIIAWTGSGALLATGIALAFFCSENYLYVEDFWNIAGGSFAGAAAWCIGFNLKANSLTRKARKMEMYSAAVINNEILNIDGKSLAAGVNVMGNSMTNTRGLGLALTFNF